MQVADQDEDLAKLLETASARLAASDREVQSAAELNEARLGRDRSWIAIAIIATYLVAILGAITYISLSAPLCRSPDCVDAAGLWMEQADLIQNLIVTSVVPVVTLMLGFYFGTENRD